MSHRSHSFVNDCIKDGNNNWMTQMLGFAKGAVRLISDVKLFLKCLFDGI